MIRRDAFRDAVKLADIAKEVAGGQTPCTQYPEAWFPQSSQGGLIRTPDGFEALHWANKAKELCLTTCEIRMQCLEYALKHKELEGIWGGTTPNERKEMLGMRKTGGRGRR